MFPSRFFPSRAFAPRYWPKVGGAATGGDPSTVFVAAERITVCVCERRGAVFERGGDLSVFTSDARGLVFDVASRGVVFFVEET